MSRRRAWITVGVLAAVAAPAYVLLARDDGILEAAYLKIHTGMTLQELEAILGPGADVVHAHPTTGHTGREVIDMPSEGPWDNRPDDNKPGRRWVWVGPNDAIMVRLGPGDRVTDKMLVKLKPLGLLDRMRAIRFW